MGPLIGNSGSTGLPRWVMTTSGRVDPIIARATRRTDGMSARQRAGSSRLAASDGQIDFPDARTAKSSKMARATASSPNPASSAPLRTPPRNTPTPTPSALSVPPPIGSEDRRPPSAGQRPNVGLRSRRSRRMFSFLSVAHRCGWYV